MSTDNAIRPHTTDFENAMRVGAAAGRYTAIEAAIAAELLAAHRHPSAGPGTALLLPHLTLDGGGVWYDVVGADDAVRLLAVGPPLILFDANEMTRRPQHSLAGELGAVEATYAGRALCARPECPACLAVPAVLRRSTAGYLLGLAEGAVNAAVHRARHRVQFGRPIGDNQGVAFPLAALSAQLTALRLLGERIAGTDGPEAPRDASHLLAACAELAMDATATAVHLHGTAGLLDDSETQLYYRKAHSFAGRYGTPSRLRRT